MPTLKDEIKKAIKNNYAIGHFNSSNLEMFKGILRAAQELSDENNLTPVIIGVSESERKYIGAEQTVAFVKTFREENNYPIFINADHCKTYESAEEAVRVGFDSIVVDNSQMSLKENIEATKRTTSILKGINPDIIIEGEMGFIGASSKLLDEIPKEAEVTEDVITKVEDAIKFVKETGVDLLSPSVGNLHGVLKNFSNPSLYIERIREIAKAVEIPLVLHGGSGIAKEEIKEAVQAGISEVHFSTDLRIAYKEGLKNLVENYFPNHPNEVAPYRYMETVIKLVQDVVAEKINLLKN